MKTILSILVFLFFTVFVGCSENPAKSVPDNERTEEAVSHNYYLMKGTQVSKKFCYVSNLCDSGELLESDTLQTSFLVEVVPQENKPDSILFAGLEGVDTRAREMYSGFNGGTAAYLGCENHACSYAKKTENELAFFLESPGGAYYGSGSLNNDLLILETEYYYRGSGADYFLEGKRILEGERSGYQYETILVGGYKITTTYSDWPIPEGDKPRVDTSRIGFIFGKEINKDHFRILGLDGADVGKRGNQVFPNCPDSGKCEIIGNMTGPESFKVNLNNDGRTYNATANFGTSGFEMEGEYNYQNVNVKYDLLGERLYKQK